MKRKSPKRQFGDRSSAFYISSALRCKKANPLHGSVGIVQVNSIYGTLQILKVQQQINRPNLNDPQTAVWGIREAQKPKCFRKHLNDLQTAVWGIFACAKPCLTVTLCACTTDKLSNTKWPGEREQLKKNKSGRVACSRWPYPISMVRARVGERGQATLPDLFFLSFVLSICLSDKNLCSRRLARTTFYNSGANDGNFLSHLDVCSRAVCSEAQSADSPSDKSW